MSLSGIGGIVKRSPLALTNKFYRPALEIRHPSTLSLPEFGDSRRRLDQIDWRALNNAYGPLVGTPRRIRDLGLAQPGQAGTGLSGA